MNEAHKKIVDGIRAGTFAVQAHENQQVLRAAFPFLGDEVLRVFVNEDDSMLAVFGEDGMAGISWVNPDGGCGYVSPASPYRRWPQSIWARLVSRVRRAYGVLVGRNSE